MNNRFIYSAFLILTFLTACAEKSTNNTYSDYTAVSSESITITTTTTTTTVSATITQTTAKIIVTVSSKTATVTGSDSTPPDGELVRILDYIPDAVIDLRYATENNFTGTVIYDDDEARLCYGTVKKLARVQQELKEKGFSIIVWDAYRPVEAQQKLWDVCPDPVYVADPRNGITSHSRGNTIDLGIVYTDGSEVVLPSGFDEFNLTADRDYSDVSAEAAENSNMLESIVNNNGFNGYWGEWWHYSDANSYTITEQEN